MSLYVPPVVFGVNPTDTAPQRWNYYGMQGWWRLPTRWFARRNADGTLTGSPNSDFSKPTFDLKVNNDGYLVFFSCGLNTYAGLMSPAQH